MAFAVIAVLVKPSCFFDIEHQLGNNFPLEITIAVVRKDPHEILSQAWDGCHTLDHMVYVAALELDGMLIDCIDPPVPNDLIDLALCTTPSAIEKLNLTDRTHARCLHVVSRDGMLLEHAVQAPDICTEALGQNLLAIQFVQQPWQTPEFFLTGMKIAYDKGILQPFMNCFL